MPAKIKPFLALTAVSVFSMTGYALASTKRNTVPYPKQVAQNFVNACAQKAPRAACECTFKKIENQYTLQEFAQLDAQASKGQPLPKEILGFISSCQTSRR
jgi:hypothetical protein